MLFICEHGRRGMSEKYEDIQKNISSGNQRCCYMTIHVLRAGVLKLDLHFTRSASVLRHLEDKRSH